MTDHLAMKQSFGSQSICDSHQSKKKCIYNGATAPAKINLLFYHSHGRTGSRADTSFGRILGSPHRFVFFMVV